MNWSLQLPLHADVVKTTFVSPFSACGAVRVPQGRIVGGNETYEGEVILKCPTSNSTLFVLDLSFPRYPGCPRSTYMVEVGENSGAGERSLRKGSSFNSPFKNINLPCLSIFLSSRHVITAAHCTKDKNKKRWNQVIDPTFKLNFQFPCEPVHSEGG